MSYSIIPPQVPFTDPNTGNIAREWYLFLNNLFINGGSGNANATLSDVRLAEEIDSIALPSLSARDLQNADPLLLEVEPWVTDMLAQITRAAQDAMLLDCFQQIDSAPAAQPVVSITVGASPFVFKTYKDGAAIVSGGTVSNVEFSRDGTNYYTTGNFLGMFPMSRGDRLRVTYTVAPTMTFVPR